MSTPVVVGTDSTNSNAPAGNASRAPAPSTRAAAP